MPKKGAMAAVGISRRKQAHGSSSRKTSCCGGKVCLAQSAAWQAEAVRERRSALKGEIAVQLYRPGPNCRRVNKDVRAPRPRPRQAAIRAAPAAAALAAAVQPLPPVDLATVVAIPAATEEDEVLPLAEAPVFFRASKPATSKFLAPRWANCNGCSGCPKC